MNKREKEVIAAQLEDEEKVIRQLERHYRLALDDVELVIRLLQSDEQTQSKIHRINYQKKLKAQLEAILEKMRMGEYKTLQQYLTGCYTSGYVGTMYDLHGLGVPVIAPINQDAAAKAIQLDTQLSTRKAYKSANGEMVALYESLGIDTESLKSTIRSEITRGIASGMTYDMMARNIASMSKAPLARAKTIARTEGHRILQQSAEDARVDAKSHGADLLRLWDATMDGDTREAHKELDGQTVEMDEYFHYGTKKAKYPGGFGDPKLDCNCRCVALSRPRSALNAKELEVLKERAAFFGLDKTESFRDFEKKYLKAAETIENPGKSGIIVPGDNGVLDLETGIRYQLAKGTKMQDVEVFAGKGSKTEFRQAAKYAERYGGAASDWQHAKGKGVLSTEDGDIKAEIHWVQCDGVGKKEMFVKEWLE